MLDLLSLVAACDERDSYAWLENVENACRSEPSRKFKLPFQILEFTIIIEQECIDYCIIVIDHFL